MFCLYYSLFNCSQSRFIILNYRQESVDLLGLGLEDKNECSQVHNLDKNAETFSELNDIFKTEDGCNFIDSGNNISNNEMMFDPFRSEKPSTSNIQVITFKIYFCYKVIV